MTRESEKTSHTEPKRRETFTSTLLMGNLGEEVDIEYRRKIILLNSVCLIGFVILIPMGVLAFYEADTYLGTFDFIMAGLLMANVILLRKTGYYKLFIYSSVVLAMIFFMYLFIFGGIHNTAFVWYYTFPLFSLFLLGLFHGSVLTFILFSSALIFFMINPHQPYFATYPLDLKLRFIPSFITVYIFAFTFEYLRDKTQKKLEESLKNVEKEKLIAERANRAKSEFLANMSHELRTPLNHIIGFTELIIGKNFGELNPTQEEYLKDVLSSSRLLLALINDILDLSKIEAGKLELDLTRVKPRALLESSLIIVKERCLKKGIQTFLNIEHLPDFIVVDERKLKQILNNLLSNAVKFTPKGGKIYLKADTISEFQRLPDKIGDKHLGKVDSTQNFLRISVSDTGIGIKPEDQERIFRPFEQVDSSMSRKYQGTGLGLSLTKRLVELHGGMIWVESAGEGKGSTFTFTIPLRGA